MSTAPAPLPASPRPDRQADALRAILQWADGYPVAAWQAPELAALAERLGPAAFAVLRAAWCRHVGQVVTLAQAGLAPDPPAPRPPRRRPALRQVSP